MMLLKNNQRVFQIISRCYSIRKAEIYNECYRVLGVSTSDEQTTIRRRYLELVKRYHPDSDGPEASVDKFQSVDNAFRILQEKFAKQRRNIDDEDDLVSEDDYGITHTPPQYRQYLSFEGIGFGTPGQRQRQYEQVKAMRAQEKILNYRLEKSQACEGAVIKKGGSYFKKHEVKTKYGYDRVVEDLIQEAMSKGEFSKLSGAGKPLSTSTTDNVYVDFTTHKINKILIDNGFSPEWIILNKEIRRSVENLKETLGKKRKRLGPVPLSDDEQNEWNSTLEHLTGDADAINKSIDKYNLIVPALNNQMLRIKIERYATDILRNGVFRSVDDPKHQVTVPSKSSATATGTASFMALMLSFFS